MIRVILTLFSLFSLVLSNEFELKIIKEILSNLEFKKKIIIYSSDQELSNSLKQNYHTTTNCSNANLLIIRYQDDIPKNCKIKDKSIFALDYELLYKTKNAFGAFFWKKGRANIVIIEPRIKKLHIKTTSSLDDYLEEKVW